MRARVATASARVVASQLRSSVYVMPGVHLIARVGHQVSSALLPPIRSTGDWSGATLRISCTSTGLIACGFDPVYSRTAWYSNEKPTKPGGIGRPTAVSLTCTVTGAEDVGGGVVGAGVGGAGAAGAGIVVAGQLGAARTERAAAETIAAAASDATSNAVNIRRTRRGLFQRRPTLCCAAVSQRVWSVGGLRNTSPWIFDGRSGSSLRSGRRRRRSRSPCGPRAGPGGRRGTRAAPGRRRGGAAGGGGPGRTGPDSGRPPGRGWRR